MTALKLLVVEDNLASLELMSEVFTSLKAEVRPISDSEKAVGVVNQEKFDGIFLDLEMPNQHTQWEPPAGRWLSNFNYNHLATPPWREQVPRRLRLKL